MVYKCIYYSYEWFLDNRKVYKLHMIDKDIVNNGSYYGKSKVEKKKRGISKRC